MLAHYNKDGFWGPLGPLGSISGALGDIWIHTLEVIGIYIIVLRIAKQLKLFVSPEQAQIVEYS